MASPVDAGRVTTAIGSTAGGGADVFNLPASIASGDILVALIASGNSSGATVSGWTSLYNQGGTNLGGSTTQNAQIFYRVANGTEGSTQAYTVTAGVKNSIVCWRITGGSGSTAPVISTIVQTSGTTSTTPNPGSLSPAGGSASYLWLWAGICNGVPTMPPTGTPTNYSNAVGINSGGSGASSGKNNAFGASRQTTAASEDPPAWTLSTAELWGAWTIAIYPGSSTVTDTLTNTATGVQSLSSDATAESPVNSTGPLLLNYFEDGADGATLTGGASGNTGSVSGSYFDTISIGTGVGVTFSKAAAFHGIMGLRFTEPVTPANSWVEWNTRISPLVWGQIFGHCYVRFSNLGSSNTAIVTIRNGANFGGQIFILSTGHLNVTPNVGSGVTAAGTAMTANNYYRIEFMMTAGPDGSQTMTVTSYLGDSLTPLETATVNNIGTQPAFTVAQFGPVSAMAASSVWDFDDLAIDIYPIGPTLGLDRQSLTGEVIAGAIDILTNAGIGVQKLFLDADSDVDTSSASGSQTIANQANSETGNNSGTGSQSISDATSDVDSNVSIGSQVLSLDADSDIDTSSGTGVQILSLDADAETIANTGTESDYIDEQIITPSIQDTLTTIGTGVQSIAELSGDSQGSSGSGSQSISDATAEIATQSQAVSQALSQDATADTDTSTGTNVESITNVSSDTNTNTGTGTQTTSDATAETDTSTQLGIQSLSLDADADTETNSALGIQTEGVDEDTDTLTSTSLDTQSIASESLSDSQSSFGTGTTTISDATADTDTSTQLSSQTISDATADTDISTQLGTQVLSLDATAETDTNTARLIDSINEPDILTSTGSGIQIISDATAETDTSTQTSSQTLTLDATADTDASSSLGIQSLSLDATADTETNSALGIQTEAVDEDTDSLTSTGTGVTSFTEATAETDTSIQLGIQSLTLDAPADSSNNTGSGSQVQTEALAETDTSSATGSQSIAGEDETEALSNSALSIDIISEAIADTETSSELSTQTIADAPADTSNNSGSGQQTVTSEATIETVTSVTTSVNSLVEALAETDTNASTSFQTISDAPADTATSSGTGMQTTSDATAETPTQVSTSIDSLTSEAIAETDTSVQLGVIDLFEAGQPDILESDGTVVHLFTLDATAETDTNSGAMSDTILEAEPGEIVTNIGTLVDSIAEQKVEDASQSNISTIVSEAIAETPTNTGTLTDSISETIMDVDVLTTTSISIESIANENLTDSQVAMGTGVSSVTSEAIAEGILQSGQGVTNILDADFPTTTALAILSILETIVEPVVPETEVKVFGSGSPGHMVMGGGRPRPQQKDQIVSAFVSYQDIIESIKIPSLDPQAQLSQHYALKRIRRRRREEEQLILKGLL